jgi:prepilin-type N-terminal cleavage/methylation domain-containing protein
MRSRRKRSSRRGQEGVSLLESLAAISLFAIVAAGTATMAGSLMRQTASNRQSTAASMLAQEELERVRGLAYNDIQDGSQSREMADKTYQVATTVQTDSPAAGMKRIRVIVSWDSPLGERSYELETIFTSITS